MPNELLASLRLLSDRDLVARLLTLAGRARSIAVEVVAHLAEMDGRDIHLREGHSSLFAYCCSVLRLSEHEAYNRIEAARAARRFPLILDLLAEGAVNLTTVRLLAPHLTAENHRSVLDSARGKRKAQVEEVVARIAPRPDVATSIRKVPTPQPVSSPTGLLDAVPPGGVATPLATLPRPAVALRPAIAPLSPDRYRIQLTIGGETLKKLRRAQDLLRHAVPSGDEAVVIDRALTALLADLEKKKLAATDRPRPSRGTRSGSRHISAAVTRAVWRRDKVAARTWGRTATAAQSGRFWSFTTRTRMRWEGSQRSRTWSFGAGGTTATRRGCTSDRFGSTWRQARARVRTNSFWNG